MGCFPSRCLGGTLDSSENNSSRERYQQFFTIGETFDNNKLRIPKDHFNRNILPRMPQDARNTLSSDGGRLDVTVTYGEQNSWQFVLAEDDDDRIYYKFEGNSWADVFSTIDLRSCDHVQLRYDNQLTFELRKPDNIRIDIISENNKSLIPKDDFNRIILPVMPQDARNTLSESDGGRLDVTVTYGKQNSWQFVLAEDDDDQSRYKIEGNSWADVLRTTDLRMGDHYFQLRYIGGKDNPLTFELMKSDNI